MAKILIVDDVKPYLDSLGIDVYDLTLNDLKTLVSKSAKMLCTFLIDQTIISGIGNYLRSEIMYFAKLNPTKKVNILTANEITNLYRGIIRALTENKLYVYKKEYDENNYKIQSFKNGSSVYWVSELQK